MGGCSCDYKQGFFGELCQYDFSSYCELEEPCQLKMAVTVQTMQQLLAVLVLRGIVTVGNKYCPED